MLLIAILGVGLAGASLAFAVWRNWHRMRITLTSAEVIHGVRCRQAVRVSIRNLGRAMGISDAHFHADKFHPESPGFTYAIESLPSQGEAAEDLLGGCLLHDGEVRSWIYAINTEAYQGSMRLRLTAQLANGKSVRSNSCVLHVAPWERGFARP